MSKKGHAGGVNAYFPNLFFHDRSESMWVKSCDSSRNVKKVQSPRKKGDFINPSEFWQKTPLQIDQKNRCNFARKS